MSNRALDEARRSYDRACEAAVRLVLSGSHVETRGGEPVLVVPLSARLSDALATLGCEFEDLELEGTVPGSIAA